VSKGGGDEEGSPEEGAVEGSFQRVVRGGGGGALLTRRTILFFEKGKLKIGPAEEGGSLIDRGGGTIKEKWPSLFLLGGSGYGRGREKSTEGERMFLPS